MTVRKVNIGKGRTKNSPDKGRVAIARSKLEDALQVNDTYEITFFDFHPEGNFPAERIVLSPAWALKNYDDRNGRVVLSRTSVPGCVRSSVVREMG